MEGSHIPFHLIANIHSQVTFVRPLSAYTSDILDCTAICWEGYIVQVSGPLEKGVAEITESLYSSVPGVKELHVKYQIPVLPWLSAICLEFQGSFE